MVKTHKEIIYQYFPDGSGCGLNHFNENKIIRMINEALVIDRLNSENISIDDMVLYLTNIGCNCRKEDIKKWLTTNRPAIR